MREKVIGLHIYSGECEHGECGIPTDLQECGGNPLFVGDIVCLATKDAQGIMCFYGMSAVVDDRPHLIGKAEKGKPFVMGIRGVDVNNDEGWYVRRVKSWEDCIEGEHWSEFGFSYRATAQDG